MKIQIKNYDDLMTILEVGRNQVFFGDHKVYVETAKNVTPVTRLENVGGKRVKVEVERCIVSQSLIVEAEPMNWTLTLGHVASNFRSMKCKFYVEVLSKAESIEQQRSVLRKAFVTAKDPELKQAYMKKLIKLSNTIVPKDDKEDLYNEAKGIFAEEYAI